MIQWYVTILTTAQGKYEEAVEKYQQVMPIFEMEYGNDSMKIATLVL